MPGVRSFPAARSRVRSHALEIGIRIAHLGQIGRPRPGVQLLEERVVARVGLRLRDPARRVANIAKLDRRGGAGLLAGRLDVAVTKLAPRELRIDLRPVDPLRAVGALLHDAARADRDVRVHRELEDVGRVLGEVEEVEAAHLVGTVVRAVAGPDAPVVDHHVEALRVVDGRGHRADLLAGGILAVHAGNRLEDRLPGCPTGSPEKYRSTRIQCISRPFATWILPTTGTLFSLWQATMHALHPMHEFRSIVIPHWWP